MKLFSYVVQHDYGDAPNPYFGYCTLCRCKYREHRGARRNVVELAKQAVDEGETVWVVGTGGADPKKSAGNGKLVYAMRVDEVLSRGEYLKDSRFKRKRPLGNGAYKRQRGDNIKPNGKFETDKQFVLVSRHFYYFGRKAIEIPDRFRDRDKLGNIEKTGRGFRSRFDTSFIKTFVKWIENRRRRGRLGEPCGKGWLAGRELKRCKSSC